MSTPPFPRALHLAVANMAAMRPGKVSLLTLNLDDLLEEALHDVLNDLDRVEEVVSRTAAAPRAALNSLEVHIFTGCCCRGLRRVKRRALFSLSQTSTNWELPLTRGKRPPWERR